MTIEEVYNNFEAQYKAHMEAYNKFCATKEYKEHKISYGDFGGPTIEYGQLCNDLMKALQDEFNLTPKQSQYIYSEAYDRFHSCFGDIFYGARTLANFYKNFPKN